MSFEDQISGGCTACGGNLHKTEDGYVCFICGSKSTIVAIIKLSKPLNVLLKDAIEKLNKEEREKNPDP